MKIVCVLGSPTTKGNSTAIARRFLETAGELEADIQSFTLNKLKYRGCQACMTCKTKLDKCVLKDDLSEVLDAVREADILLMASPVYYGDVTSQMKGFIDRTFSFLGPDFHTNPNSSRLSPGKKLVFILAQQQPDEKTFSDIYPKYESFFKWYNYTDNHLIRACGVAGPGEAEKKTDIMQLAEETARKVMS